MLCVLFKTSLLFNWSITFRHDVWTIRVRCSAETWTGLCQVVGWLLCPSACLDILVPDEWWWTLHSKTLSRVTALNIMCWIGGRIVVGRLRVIARISGGAIVSRWCYCWCYCWCCLCCTCCWLIFGIFVISRISIIPRISRRATKWPFMLVLQRVRQH